MSTPIIVPDSLEGIFPLPDPGRFATRDQAAEDFEAALASLGHCLRGVAILALQIEPLWAKADLASRQLVATDATDPYRTGTKLAEQYEERLLDLCILAQHACTVIDEGGRLIDGDASKAALQAAAAEGAN